MVEDILAPGYGSCFAVSTTAFIRQDWFSLCSSGKSLLEGDISGRVYRPSVEAAGGTASAGLSLWRHQTGRPSNGAKMKFQSRSCAGGRKLIEKLKIISRRRWRFWANKHMNRDSSQRGAQWETNAHHWFDADLGAAKSQRFKSRSLEKLVEAYRELDRALVVRGDKNATEKVAFVQRA